MSSFPFVSIVIPCRDEQKFIAACLDSIIANDYPKDRLEVLVVDGMSGDGTREIVKRYTQEYGFTRLLDNPRKIIPAAMNTGIRNAQGTIIVKVDVHSFYPVDYVSKCVKFLREYGAYNVGGILNIIPREETRMAKAVALVLSHPFGSGNAYVKVGSKEPRWADTAAFGCYKKEVFEKIGLFNEKLAGSSDMDLNYRLRKVGGRILVVPEIVVRYYADPTLKAFWRHTCRESR